MATFLTSQDNGDNDSGDGNNSNRDGDGDDDADSAMEQVPTVGEWAGCSRRFMAPIQISTRGNEILTDPLYNKGTAFKSGERDRLRFRGLLPPRVFNMELQKERFLLSLRAEESTIRKHLMLEDLHDRNETLYHRVLVSKNPHDSCFGWEGNLIGTPWTGLDRCFCLCFSPLWLLQSNSHYRSITLKKWPLSFILQL
jgi:hypothetical protein